MMTTTILINLSIRFTQKYSFRNSLINSNKKKQRQSSQKQPKRDPLDVFGDSDENEPPSQSTPSLPPPSSITSTTTTMSKTVPVKEEMKMEKKKETKFVDEVLMDKDNEPKAFTSLHDFC